MRKLWIGISCYCLTLFNAFAQDQTYQLFLQSGNFTPQEVSEQRLVVPYVQTHAEYKIIQFVKIPTEVEREKLKSAGINLLGYVPNNAFFASIQPRTNLSSTELTALSIRAIVSIEPSHKIKPNLLEKPLPIWAVKGEGQIDVIVSIFDDYQGEDVPQKLSQYGEVLEKSDNSHFTVRVEENQLENLANVFFVSYIEAISPEPQAEEGGLGENDDAVSNQRSNTLKSNGLHFDGSGVTVSIGDTDIPEESHIDLETRLVIKSASSSRGKDHATHCAGILGGAGNLDPQYEGQASGATILGYNSTNDYSSTNISNNFNSLKLRVTSHSLGWTCNGGYDSEANKVDQQAITYDGLLHVYSAGNSGSQDCGQYPTGWGNITGGPKQGKNVLAIANTSVTDILSSSSSRGPAADGRIKPDVAAVGSSVYSTQANNTYSSKSGTSMACPAVAGVLAQLIQAHKELNGGQYPQGGLLKGTLLNTADDKGNTGPDFKYGWGRVNALKAYNLLKEKRYTSASISNGQKQSHSFTIPANVKEAKIMVYWMDVAASSGVSKALVNDLDVTVNNGTYQPWTLSVSTTSTTILNTPAQKGADHTNNMEQVSITNPSAGTYTVDVDGFSIPQGSQEYFVLYEYVYDEITVTHPIGGEGLVTGDSEYIRWDAEGNTGSFKVEYSINDGTSWTTLSSAVSGTSRYYAWSIPSSLKSKAIVRVSRNGISDVSDAPFLVLPKPTNVKVEWVCDTEYQVSWSAVSGADSYTVYQMGATHMDSIGTTTGNTFVVPSLSTKSEYYSVSANIGNIKGRRTVALQKSATSSTSCPGKNIVLSKINNPLETACLLGGSQIDISVDVANNGNEIINGYTVNYQLGTGQKISESFSTILQLGQTETIVFKQKLTLPTTGVHKLIVSVDIVGDVSILNNTKEIDLSISSNSASLPLVENFDGETTCVSTSACETVSCPLTGDWTNVLNGSDDTIDWRVISGSTASTSTGPSGDHTSGSGKYLYLESSSCYSKKAILTSSCLNLSKSSELSFWYHMYGSSMGTLEVKIITESKIETLHLITGDQGNNWKEKVIDLTSYVGQTVKIEFIGTTGTNYYSDISIDDISIQEGLVDKVVFNTVANQTTYDLCGTVTFEGRGPTTVQNYTWNFGVGASPQTATGVGPHTVSYTTTGSKTITFKGDAFTETKVDYVTITNQATSLPLVENFDGLSTCTNTSSCEISSCSFVSDWQNITSTQEDNIDWLVYTGSTTSTGTGPSGDHTSGNGKYLYLEASSCLSKKAILTSPCLNLSKSSELSFWYHMYGTAVGTLEIKVITGTKEEVIKTISGNQGNVWTEEVISLAAYIGQTIKIQIIGTTGIDFSSDIAIDDLLIEEENLSEISFNTISQEICGAVTFVGKGPSTIQNYTWNFGAGASPQTATGIGPHTVTYTTIGSKTITFNADTLSEKKIDYLTISSLGTTTSLPLVENFEGLIPCSSTSTCEFFTCSLGGDWDNISNTTDDNIDWRINKGSTNSSSTGPSGDHTTGSGQYLYLEASSCYSKKAILSSSCLNLSKAVELSFWYHMYGSSMGDLQVKIIASSKEEIIWTLSGDQGNSWKEVSIDLAAYIGQTIKVQIIGTTGTDFYSDISIDDISIEETLVDKVLFNTVNNQTNHNLCGTVTFLGQGPKTVQNYAWDFGTGASPQTATGIGPHTVTYLTSGKKTVTFTGDALTETKVDYLTISNQSLTVLPLSQDFEALSICTTASSCESIECPLDKGWTNLANGQGDNIDWKINQGSTSSISTGPTGDHTTGLGNYLYLEASSCYSKKAILTSPCLSLSKSSELSFWYHMYGASMGMLEVNIITATTNKTLKTLSGDQGNSWKQLTIDLTPYVGEAIKIEIVGTTGINYYSDISIDDILIEESLVDKVMFSTVSEGVCGTVTLLGKGPSTVQNYSWDFGAGASPQTATGIGPHTVTYLTSGSKTITFKGDALTETKVDYLTINNLSRILPITQNFESMNICSNTSSCESSVCSLNDGWTNLTNNTEDDIDWLVHSGATGSTSTGPTGDHTIGSGKYMYLEASSCTYRKGILTSPCFKLDEKSNLSFWYHMYGSTMGSLQIRIVKGTQIIAVKTLSGDQGNLWKQEIIDLSAYLGETIKVQFVGETGTNIYSDIAIDDILIESSVIKDVSFTATNSIMHLCSTITFEGKGPIGTQNYTWDFGAGAQPQTATGIGPHTVSYSTLGAKTITFTGDALTETKVDFINVLKSSNVATIQISKDGGVGTSCENTLTKFTAVTTNAGNATYQWFVNGQITGFNSNTLSIPANDQDNVYCMLTSSLECLSTKIVKSNILTVNTVSTGVPYRLEIDLTSAVPANISWKLSKIGVLVDEFATYTENNVITHNFCLQEGCYQFEIKSSNNSYSYTDYVLTDPNNTVIGQKNNFYQKGIHDFCVSATNVFEQELENVEIYPNPVKNVLNVSSDNYLTAQLIDILGNEIETKEGTMIQFNVEGLSSGIYFVKIIQDNQQKVVQVVIE